MKVFFILFFKGFIIGIAKIIPGVSGAIIAISLGVYEKILNIMSNLFNNIKDNVKFTFPLVLGFFISLIVFSKLVDKLMNNFYLSTMLLFTGLITGSLGELKVNLKNKNNFLIFLVTIIFILYISIINTNIYIEHNVYSSIFMGVIEAISMVVPGLSGTALMMMFNYYDILIYNLSNFKLISLTPFFIGVIIGGVIFSKIASYMFEKYEEKTKVVIYSFAIFSIIVLLLDTFNKSYNTCEIIISVLLIPIGYNISKIFICKKYHLQFNKK